MNDKTRFIFVCGGVLSGVGKGVATASLGYLLKEHGYSVTAVKIDPYLNIDAGLMRPAEHGEVFVTEDGGEIDQDLGNYERFLDITFSKCHNITSGKVYERVLENERQMKYGGRDVEIFPDLINEVKQMITECVDGEDFCLVEIGGTTGDVENLPFLHAAREMGREFEAAYIMVTYLPFLRTVGELKTKPTQHAVARLREVGIMPDFIVTRNEVSVDEPRKETISKRCFIPIENIIDNPDLDSIYKVPILFNDAGFDKKILEHFKLAQKSLKLSELSNLVKNLSKDNTKKLSVALVGKYITHGDSMLADTYISVTEALKHAAGYLERAIDINMIPAAEFEDYDEDLLKKLEQFDAVIIPQGWGTRGSEGKINAIRYIREHKIPYLGLCYGMQMACIEYARNVVNLKNATSEEVKTNAKVPIIHIMPDQKEYLSKQQFGGTIRLGGWECKLDKNSISYALYEEFGLISSEGIVSERHRHRYEFNNEYKKPLEEAGLVIAGTSKDGKLVEFIELPKEDHQFFVGTQAHPEYKSKPLKPHPLFVGLLRAGINRGDEKR